MIDQFNVVNLVGHILLYVPLNFKAVFFFFVAKMLRDL